MKKNSNIRLGIGIRCVHSKSAFTLAEMMVVMLVLSIILAASLPLITKKSTVDDAHIWRYVPTDRTHVYYGTKITNSAMVGTKVPPSAGKAYNSMFYINTPEQTATYPQLAFGVAGTPYGIQYVTTSGAIALGSLDIETPGTASVGIGKTANASGENAVAIGNEAKATGKQATSLGYNTNASEGNATAIGFNARATGKYATALGDSALAQTQSSTALADSANAEGDRALAIGFFAKASGNRAIAIGNAASENSHIAHAASDYSVAIGYGTVANNTAYDGLGVANRGYSNVAIGCDTEATGAYSTAIGDHTHSTGSSYSIAIGAGPGTGAGAGGTTASGMFSTAVGATYNHRTLATNRYASAFGAGAQATGDQSTAIGAWAEASGYQAMALGDDTYAKGENSIAIGSGAQANYSNSTAIGAFTSVSMANTIQIGPQKYNGANCVVFIPGKIYLASPGFGSPTYLYEDTSSYVRTVKIPFKSASLSDRRVKNIIEGYKSSLAQIRELKVYKYRFKEDEMVERYKKALMHDIDNPACPDKRPAQFKKCVDKLGEKYRETGRKKGLFEEEHVGIVAQDLVKVFPESVTTDKDGYKNIDTNEIFYAIINAIKELDSKVNEIAKKIGVKDAKDKADSEKDFQQRLNVLKTHLFVLNSDIKELKNNVVYKSDLDKQISSIDKKFNNSYVYFTDKNEDLKNRLSALYNELKATKKEVNSLKSEVKALKKENNDLRKRLERLEQKIK